MMNPDGSPMTYNCYGPTIASELALPEMIEAESVARVCPQA